MRRETREAIGAQTDLLISCLRALGLSATRPRSKHYTNAHDWHRSRLLRPEFAICRRARTVQPGVQSRELPDSHSRLWPRRQSPAQWPPRSLADDARTTVSALDGRSGDEPLRCWRHQLPALTKTSSPIGLTKLLLAPADCRSSRHRYVERR